MRYLAGTLVVVGHAVTPFMNLDGILWIYIATWAMRLPAFAMIAGYFSPATPLSARQARRLVESVLVPYIIFSLLHTLQVRVLRGGWHFFIVDPVPTLWFLLSLIFWRAALPYVVQLRFPFTISALAALLVGFVEGIDFSYSASQTVTFFPFFLVGWKISQGGWLKYFIESAPKSLCVSLTVAPFVGMWYLKEHIERSWLSMSRPYYSEKNLDLMWAVPFRFMALAWGVIGAVSLIRIIPPKKIPVITYLGAGGLYMYLIHPLVLRQLYWFDFYEGLGGMFDAMTVFVGAVLSAALMASRPVRKITRPLVQPRLPWIFSPPESPRENERAERGRSRSEPGALRK
ncbi:acyltransferase family protein [Streptomyces sp. NPDC002845]